jgi:crotonobetainyl-CoA:carnitine CoA-transferase CaiB-like acyl-CoA transferase
VPYRVFETQDREIAVAVGSEKLWRAFCIAIERPELELRPDYATNAQRIRNRDVLESLLGEVFARRPASEWVKRLQAAGIPASLVRNFEEVAEHPQSAVRRMFPQIDHPTAGRHTVTGTPVKLSETPGGPGLPAPLMGQHTRKVLKDLLGLDEPTLDRLAAKCLIYQTEMGGAPEDFMPPKR